MSVKICNSLPDYLIKLIHDNSQFIGEIKYIQVLSHNPSYTIDEFFFAPLSGFTAEKGKNRLMCILL
jgi:hypothetical protein